MGTSAAQHLLTSKDKCRSSGKCRHNESPARLREQLCVHAEGAFSWPASQRTWTQEADCLSQCPPTKSFCPLGVQGAPAGLSPAYSHDDPRCNIHALPVGASCALGMGGWNVSTGKDLNTNNNAPFKMVPVLGGSGAARLSARAP